MKKYGIGWILLDIYFVIEAWASIHSGNGTFWDYGLLYFALTLLVAIILRKVDVEIKARKKLKQMREEEKMRKSDRNADPPA